jgi:hypothetical protein
LMVLVAQTAVGALSCARIPWGVPCCVNELGNSGACYGIQAHKAGWDVLGRGVLKCEKNSRPGTFV